MPPTLGTRYEIGNPADPALYEVASLRGPLAPQHPIVLRLIRPSSAQLTRWDAAALRHGIDRARYRREMCEAGLNVRVEWLGLPFVRRVGGKVAA